jgi:hypothetical protein
MRQEDYNFSDTLSHVTGDRKIHVRAVMED